jgi:MULE transposase domain
MFPEVLKIDCTAGTNNENRPLLVASGLDSDRTVFHALQAYLPNERTLVFRWLFEKVFILLLGSAMCRCRMIITDGDAQEIRTLDNAKEDIDSCLFYGFIHRQQCCWHLISRSWQRKIPKLVGKAADIGTNIRQWLYSFCESNAVESYE